METPVNVTVICTCFNKGPWIRRALESVVSQKTSFPFDLVVVDDASTDESVSEIREFQKAHPDSVRTVFHERNLGITATWLEACDLVTGTYVARLDGDDYWTKDDKLERQVALLEASDDSDWCCTDFDIIDSAGNVISPDAIATGAIARVDTYETMLATKGLVNSSTWLVKTSLMREANKVLDTSEADDTFSIQLELFHRTRLSRIEESMCVFRTNAGSDSKPMTHEGAERRFRGLERQQLLFVDKYADADFRQMSRELIMRDTDNDIRIFGLDRTIDGLRAENARLQEELAEARRRYESIVTSKRWRAMEKLARLLHR